MTAHTPTPWKYTDEEDEDSCMGRRVFTIHSEANPTQLGIANMVDYEQDAEANAALIVKAVNCHAEWKEDLIKLYAFEKDRGVRDRDSIALAAIAKEGEN